MTSHVISHFAELKETSYKNHNEIKVIWHPKGAEEIIPDDKVYYPYKSRFTSFDDKLMKSRLFGSSNVKIDSFCETNVTS